MTKKKHYYVTEKGLVRLRKEYADLKKIKCLKTDSDPPALFQSEDLNPDYLSFHEDLELLETRLKELKEILDNTEMISMPDKCDQNHVGLGATVALEICGAVEELKILGTVEVDPEKNIISDESPLGQALLGKRVGDAVSLKDSICHSFKILKVRYNGFD